MHVSCSNIQEGFKGIVLKHITVHFSLYKLNWHMQGELPPELQKVYSRNARAFVTACLQPHDSRPTAEQLLSHEFLKEKEEEDFKFVRGKLGSGGLEELQEEDDEGAHVAPDENYPDGAGPAPSMGIVKSAGNTSSPSRTTISLGSVSVLQEERTVAGGHGNAVINSNESSGNTSVMDSASSGLLFSTADIREGVRHSGNLKSSNETLVGGADGDCNNGRRHSRGGSGDSSGLGRSRILRVQTRAGSASGTDLRPSPVISGPSNPIFNGEVPIINPLIISNSGEEKAAATNDGQLSGEANVPNQLLTTATVFDLLDIENSESGLAKTNESLIFMMSVPGKDLESYKEVGFEFNLLADEPSVLVEEMQTDPDLMDIIEPHASVIVTVLTAVCEVAKRVAVNRIQSNIFDTSLSDAVLIEILKIQAQRDLSYSHFVDCGEGVAIDPLENLCVTARNRKLSSDCNGDLNCYSVSDAEADKLICQDPSYLDLLSSLEENLSR